MRSCASTERQRALVVWAASAIARPNHPRDAASQRRFGLAVLLRRRGPVRAIGPMGGRALAPD
jgi:hypothetical protein